MLPYEATELIKLLDKQYPNKYPDLRDSDREIWFNAGARSVVDRLINEMKRDEKNSKKKLQIFPTQEDFTSSVLEGSHLGDDDV